LLDAIQSFTGLAVTKRAKLDRFFSAHEQRAFSIAMASTKSVDQALDIVQEAMLKMVEYYAEKPEETWPPLFFRVLSSKIADWGRSQSKLSLHDSYEDDQATDTYSPEASVVSEQRIGQLVLAAERLSPREHQVLVLRAIEGYSTKETATALECSEGTVKALLNRARSKMGSNMEEHHD